LEEDLVTVRQTDPALKALWLETFTNSLKGMLHSNLNINAKYEFADNFFPSRGALPPPDFWQAPWTGVWNIDLAQAS